MLLTLGVSFFTYSCLEMSLSRVRLSAPGASRSDCDPVYDFPHARAEPHDARAWRRRFRELNPDYAARVVAAGLSERIDPIGDDDDTLDRRQDEIFAEYVLREW